MTERPVIVERTGAVATITINRPDKRNALDNATRAALLAAFGELAHDGEVRCAIVTGAGAKAFVAGADVREFVGRSSRDVLDMLLQSPSIFDAADAFPKPLIAMINGYCLGSGNELAMACDIRIASERARFGQTEIGLGMMPGGGATQRLPRLVGLGRAYKLLYTGQIIDAAEALRMGLVDEVVPDGELASRTMLLAEMIASRSLASLSLIKEAVRASVRAPLDDGVRHEASLAAILFSSADVNEGIRAFLEKRQARFNQP
jgi:enoyl-CoA hydratase